MPAAGAGGPSAAAAPAPEAPGAGLPFSLTLDELDAAELIDEPELAPLTRGRGSMHDPAGAFAAPAARQPTPISQAPAAAAHRARFAPLPETQPGLSRSAIDMISGLQMNVCVELGRTELTVADVLGLGAGSVIELNRLAGEPVDILVNDRLIARGEVVVVDENFGVRVVEVVRRPAPDLEERAG
ncbi:MAG: flagellar motor switch protein FliN [Chloroflexi bacterium]|nr:flagellar motor switch protein FliN [Chloroflexota bacterium]